VPILAGCVDVVIGVDAHTDTHTAALVSSVGAVISELTVPADGQALDALSGWVQQHAAGQRRHWVIEGSRSHGVGLLRQLRAAGEQVAEAPRLKRPNRRGRGKSDALDAAAIARAALAAPALSQPRADGNREALRLLLVTRQHLSDHRTATVNLLKSLILTADDELREQLRRKKTQAQVRHLLTLPVPTGGDVLIRIRREQMVDFAHRITDLDQTLAANKNSIAALVKTVCAELLGQVGVGPVTAAILLCAWSHKGRVRDEAAFASLAGTNPVPASSGRTVRHRLNRGGDRRLNSALHTIAVTRRRCEPATRDYVTRRTHEGKSSREITRAIKRYLSRSLFRIMEANANFA
jgi:transposase